MTNEGARYNRKTVKNGKLKSNAVPLKQHLEDLKSTNNSYKQDTANSPFNISSGEGSPGMQTVAGYELAKKSKTYFFRNPGRNRAEREAGAAQPSYQKDEPVRGAKQRVQSGDIQISKKRQAFEEALAPRLEKIEQEYAAAKAAKESGIVLRVNKKA